MNTGSLDGKTLYLETTDKRYYGTMKSAGRTVTLRWLHEQKDTEEAMSWSSMTLKENLFAKLRRNDEGRTITFWGKKTPDYYYPDDALDH
jgi:hypothetical protein